MVLASYRYSRHSGLGNKLFGWARAQVFCHETGARQLQPMWFSPHGGGVLRGGIDYWHALSKVWLFGNFRSREGEMSLIEYYLKYSKWPIVPVRFLPEALRLFTPGKHFRFDPTDASTQNFSDLSGRQGFLREQLLAIAAPRAAKQVAGYLGRDYIALNVRCGNDFVTRESGRRGLVKTGLDWYASALKMTREKYGNLPAVVVSDGGVQQLASLLSLPDVALCRSSFAISDLLICTNARVFLGCGNSSFCAWASYLGEMDAYSSATETIDRWFRGVRGRNGKQIIGTI